jgi:hypothetical protein
MDPHIKIIAPWREWDLNSRTALMAFAKKHGIRADHAGQTLQHGRQSAAHQLRRRHPGRSLGGAARRHFQA